MERKLAYEQGSHVQMSRFYVQKQLIGIFLGVIGILILEIYLCMSVSSYKYISSPIAA